jgi:alkylated DNA repair dioxygenase AlkB
MPMIELREVALPDGSMLLAGEVPEELIWDDVLFADVWSLHPADRHIVKIYGRETPVPRWQQAYGADYSYTGSRNNALPFPNLLRPLLVWVQDTVDPRLNGMLLNWYDGPTSYIGAHNDDTRDLIASTPIVTLSFGEARTFRLQSPKDGSRENVDLEARHGTMFVMPWETNVRWKHAVPKRARYRGRRISVTLRSFRHALYE